MRRPTIAVCGSSGVLASPVSEMAEQLGVEILRAGFHLVCGGMDGIMEAVSRGYAEARVGGEGLIIGILPGASCEDANRWIDVPIPTGLGYARNTLVALAGDAVVLCGGGSGTLSEAAFAWQAGKPVVALAPTGGWALELAGRKLDERRGEDRIHRAESPREAIEWISGRVRR